MSIPIIISRKKPNGQSQKINISLTSPLHLQFDKTFNPNTLKEIKQSNTIQQENYQYQDQKLACDSGNRQKLNNSRIRVRRRISSSGVSKRFPKDFFNFDQQKQKDEQLINNYHQNIHSLGNNTSHIKNIIKNLQIQQGSKNLLITLKRINTCKPDRQKVLLQKIFKTKKNVVKNRHKTLQPRQHKKYKNNQDQENIPETPKFSAKGNKNKSRQIIQSKQQSKGSTTIDSALKIFKQNQSNYYNKKKLLMSSNYFEPLQPEILQFNNSFDKAEPCESSQKKQNNFLNKFNLLKCQQIKPFKLKNSSAKVFIRKLNNQNYHNKANLMMIRKFTLSSKQKKENKQNKNQLVFSQKKIDNYNTNKKNKFIFADGQKIGSQQNCQDQYKIKMFDS